VYGRPGQVHLLLDGRPAVPCLLAFFLGQCAIPGAKEPIKVTGVAVKQVLLLAHALSREVWVILLRRAGFEFLAPAAESKVPDWWLLSRKRVPKDCSRGF
jgi:hypothetical protein